MSPRESEERLMSRRLGPVNDVYYYKRSPTATMGMMVRKNYKGKEKIVIHEWLGEMKPKSKLKGLGFCKICQDYSAIEWMFAVKRCKHSFCPDCTRQHIATSMKENMIKIPCPDSGCACFITPKTCQFLLPDEVIDRWATAVTCSQSPPLDLDNYPITTIT
ncbi:Zinc finger, C3HC4 RING-type [Corchorus capsularis]|uniref:Zinc finger, C3HC4 RING-type n=1 Tax=Corchorus capsularis TaxID=210143 RepID=A0A1R3JWJ0_COCAP|nr:Zinc finger, C3HC4 RING-type [Corchorus capsularis]